MKTLFLILTILTLSVFTVQARTVRLADYGTPGDNLDDAAGFQNAVNDLAASGGGTLVIGEGVWDVNQGISLVNEATNVTSIRISGNKGAIIQLALNEEATFLNIGNGVQAELSGLVVISKPTGPRYDGGYFLQSLYTGQTIIQNCNFFGLFMKYDFIKTGNTDLIVEKCIFGGNAANGAHIHVINFMGLTVRDALFLDYYHFLDTYYSKTPDNIGYWIKAENIAMPLVNATGTKAVTVTNTRFDEGAPVAISVQNSPYADISDIIVNVGSTSNSTGIQLDNVVYAQIKMAQFGFTMASRPAIYARRSTIEAIGLRFANGVFFADVDRATKVFKEKCAQCLEMSVEAGGAVEPKIPGGIKTGKSAEAVQEIIPVKNKRAGSAKLEN
jgi:hypothetical protein